MAQGQRSGIDSVIKGGFSYDSSAGPKSCRPVKMYSSDPPITTTPDNDTGAVFAYRRRYVERRGSKFRGYVVLIMNPENAKSASTFAEMSTIGLLVGLGHEFTIATSQVRTR